MDSRNLRTSARCLVFICLFLGTQALIYTKPLFIPFVFSIFIYASLRSSAHFLERHLKLSVTVAMTSVMLLALLLSAAFFGLVSFSLADFASSTSAYAERLKQFPIWLNQQLTPLGLTFDQSTVRDGLTSLPFAQYARNVTGSITQILGNAVLVIIFVMFLLLGEKKSSSRRSKRIPLIEEMFNKISLYAGAKTVLSLLTGLLTGLLYMFMGVDLALLFAILTVVLNFIPNVGSIIAVLLPLPVILLQFGPSWQSFTIVLFSGLIQFSIGNVLEPRLMGKNLELHPVVVLLSLIFWGLIWGIPGMFLAVPITAIMKTVMSLFDTTRPFVGVLEGDLSVVNVRSDSAPKRANTGA